MALHLVTLLLSSARLHCKHLFYTAHFAYTVHMMMAFTDTIEALNALRSGKFVVFN